VRAERFYRGQWQFRKSAYDFFYFFTYQPKILHIPEGENEQNCTRRNFELSPLENLAPLNFTFALRPVDGGNGDFENRHTIFLNFFTYRPEIRHTLRG